MSTCTSTIEIDVPLSVRICSAVQKLGGHLLMPEDIAAGGALVENRYVVSDLDPKVMYAEHVCLKVGISVGV